MSNHSPELASVESFLAYLADDERSYITREELMDLSAATHTTTAKIAPLLRARGIVVVTDERRDVRGFTANPNTRWQACPSHGGGGGSCIEGFAGDEG